jgi:hypothetical protein
MVQLIRQRRQRPAPGPADHDLPDQVTGERLRQHPALHPQQLHRRLPGAGDVRVIQDSQLVGDPYLQCLQQRRLPGHRRVWCRLAEDLTDHHRQLLSLLAARWGQFHGGQLDRGLSHLAQRTLLISAENSVVSFLRPASASTPTSHAPRSSATNTTSAVFPVLWRAARMSRQVNMG